MADRNREEPDSLLKDAWESADADRLDYAFRVFFDAYKALVAFCLSGYLRNEQDVDEALNETFASFFAHLGDYFRGKGKRYPKAYLLKIARNKAMDRLRKEAPWNDGVDLDMLPSPARKRTYADVEEDLRTFLNEQETEIVLLVLQGYTAKEIGRALHLTRGNVSVKYSRALAKLRERKEANP